MREIMMQKESAVMAAVVVFALQPSCGKKQGPKARGRVVPEKCRKLASRHKQCLDALAVVARDRGTELLLRTMANLSSEERRELRDELRASLKRNQADFRKLLAGSFDKEFPAWCAGAVSSSKSRERVEAMNNCLSKPDCQTYAACIGNVLSGIGPAPLRNEVRSGPSMPSAASTGDATRSPSPGAGPGPQGTAAAQGDGRRIPDARGPGQAGNQDAKEADRKPLSQGGRSAPKGRRAP